MNGLLYDPAATSLQSELDSLVALYLRYLSKYGPHQAYFKLNEDAYIAQFAVTTNTTTENWAINAFDFCGFNCALISILVNDKYSLTATDYFYQLTNASCRNAIDYSNW